MEKQPDISVLFVVLLTAFATFWSIKKDTADYSDYIRNGGEQDADRLLFIPGKNQGEREVVYGTVKDFCKCKSNFNSAISIITLPHVQDPWNTVDGTKIQVIQPVFSAGKSEDKAVRRRESCKVGIVTSAW